MMYIEKMAFGDLPVLFDKVSAIIDQVYTQEMVGSLVREWPAGCFVLRSENSIEGFILGKKDGRGFARICLLGVDVRYRGNGFGTMLMKKLLDRCIMDKIYTIRLEVAMDNDVAQRFYEKLGFRREKILHQFYCDGRNALEYVKFL